MDYLTAVFRNLPALLCLSLLLASCGSPVGSATPGQTPAAVVSPSSAARSTRAPTQDNPAVSSPTSRPSPIPTLGGDLASLKGVNVRFWYAWNGEDTDPWPALIADFNRTNTWGIVVNGAVFPELSDIFDQVQSSIYGELPDVLIGYNYQAMRQDRAGSLLVDLGPYVQDPRWGYTSAEVGDFIPLFWGQDVQNGKRLGLPFYRLEQGLFYNLTWARELGFSQPPASSAEFKTQACAASQANQKDSDPAMHGTGGWVINWDAPTLASWLFAYGSDLSGPGGNAYNFNNSAARQAFTFLRDLQDSGCAWASENLYPNAEFASRQALFISASAASLPAQQDAFQTATASDHWTVMAFPPSSPARRGVVDAYGPSLSLLKSNPQRQLAGWLFIKWLDSPETQARWAALRSVLPVRTSALSRMADYRQIHPQWGAMADLLPQAHVEPPLISWGVVNWALSDAGKELFSATFQSSQLPTLLLQLDQTAKELDGQYR